MSCHRVSVHCDRYDPSSGLCRRMHSTHLSPILCTASWTTATSCSTSAVSAQRCCATRFQLIKSCQPLLRYRVQYRCLYLTELVIPTSNYEYECVASRRNKFCESQWSTWPWPWPRIGSYCIPSCITHRPLPTCQSSLKSKELFVDGRTYGRTYGRADRHLRPIVLGRLGRVDLIVALTVCI